MTTFLFLFISVCQQCSPGYYRDTKGLFLGKCVPCNCNGHSDQCLDGSGICVVSSAHYINYIHKVLNPKMDAGFNQALAESLTLHTQNCRHNTAGNHCEKCQGGFHGNNTVDGHAVSCSSCPCPLQVASNKSVPLFHHLDT